MTTLTPRIDSIESSRDLFINGSFRIWQRGTAAITLSASDKVLVDRWTGFSGITAATVTMAQDASVPTLAQAGIQLPWSCKITATTGGTAASNEGAGFYYKMEGYDYLPLHGGTPLCFQFWVKAAKTGTMTVIFHNSNSSRKYVTTVTINAANTWETKQVNISSDTTGTWLFTNGVGLQVGCMLDGAGVRITSTLNQWFDSASPSFAVASTQTHFLSTTNDYVQFAGMQLLPANYTSAAAITMRNLQQELAMCQRYCQIIGWDSATNGMYFGMGQCGSGTTGFCVINLITEMRTNPTLSSVTSAAANFSVTTSVGGTAALTVIALNNGNPQLVGMNFTVASGLVAGNATLLVRATGNTTAVLGFEAEL